MRYTIVGIAVASLAALGVNDVLRATRLTEATGTVQAKLDSIPLMFGDWKGEAVPFDEKLLKATRAVAHRNLVFTRGGARPAKISVLLLAGAPGDIGAHDPERCYGSTGYRSTAARTQKHINDIGLTHAFWSERFERETLPAGTVEVCWSWTDDGHWLAAEDARFSFMGRPILYKIYASRMLSVADDDPISELLRELAPLKRTALAGAHP